ncbi:hypothetical protein FJZ33_11385 [Candidatus Poribacteria bacterium]|nr:hypothetical protein [Candidatus Poribacteria bacterium]MBM4398975.1 hypothetical protein [Candidatus Cloacimonadota bacterium]
MKSKLLKEEELGKTRLESDWEPAEKLLARIKAEKSGGDTPKTAGNTRKKVKEIRKSDGDTIYANNH